MFGSSLRLGTLAGISVRIHSTFLVLLALLSVSELMRGYGLAGVVGELTLTTFVFGIVVLHELGHALTARRFGIATRDITLYPIGGIARLEHMPENPKQELLIALAGPAVNLALAGAGIGLIAANVGAGHLPLLLRFTVINSSLALFNLIPAFPMDGGRVLRALMARRHSYVQATHTAAIVGKWFALLLAVAGLVYNPMLMLIAAFVWFAGRSEERMVQYRYASQHADPFQHFAGHAWPGARGTRIPHYTVEDAGVEG